MDIQFIQLLDLVPLRQVLPIALEVPTLDIYGGDFSRVVAVFMNGVKSPDVVVVSPGRLLAQVPDSLVGGKISDIGVYSSGLILTERTKLDFTLENDRKVSGLLRLIQTFVKLLLQTPGRDSFDTLGGGFLSLIGSNIGYKQQLENAIRDGVDNLAIALRRRQNADTRIPLEEKLQSADIVALRAVPETGQVDVRVAIRNQAGQTGISLVSSEATT